MASLLPDTTGQRGDLKRTVRFLVRWFQTRPLAPSAIYCLAFGALSILGFLWADYPAGGPMATTLPAAISGPATTMLALPGWYMIFLADQNRVRLTASWIHLAELLHF